MPPAAVAHLPRCRSFTHAGRPPHNKGMRYPADPPTIEEIVTVMRHAGDGVHGRRLRTTASALHVALIPELKHVASVPHHLKRVIRARRSGATCDPVAQSRLAIAPRSSS